MSFAERGIAGVCEAFPVPHKEDAFPPGAGVHDPGSAQENSGPPHQVGYIIFFVCLYEFSSFSVLGMTLCLNYYMLIELLVLCQMK
jgi:hypothetical protein